MTKKEIEDQLKTWLQEHDSLIKHLHNACIAVGNNLPERKGYAHTISKEITRGNVVVRAHQEVDRINPRSNQPIVSKRMYIFVNKIRVANLKWFDSEIFSKDMIVGYKDNYIRPGDWMNVAKEIIDESIKKSKDDHDEKEKMEKKELLDMLYADMDL